MVERPPHPDPLPHEDGGEGAIANDNAGEAGHAALCDASLPENFASILSGSHAIAILLRDFHAGDKLQHQPVAEFHAPGPARVTFAPVGPIG